MSLGFSSWILALAKSGARLKGLTKPESEVIRMAFLPTVNNYMGRRYSSDNYGAHSLEVDLGLLCLYYSYKTVVAFRYKGKLTVRVNDWSTTTGKHLNEIDGGDKKSRIEGEKFEKQLAQVLVELGLSER